MSNETDTDSKTTVATVIPIFAAGMIPLPKVITTLSPANRAPRITNTPNNPGIANLLITFAPYAALNEGAVPLPPMLIARKIPTSKGKMIGVKNIWLDLFTVDRQFTAFLLNISLHQTIVSPIFWVSIVKFHKKMHSTS